MWHHPPGRVFLCFFVFHFAEELRFSSSYWTEASYPVGCKRWCGFTATVHYYPEAWLSILAGRFSGNRLHCTIICKQQFIAPRFQPASLPPRLSVRLLLLLLLGLVSGRTRGILHPKCLALSPSGRVSPFLFIYLFDLFNFYFPSISSLLSSLSLSLFPPLYLSFVFYFLSPPQGSSFSVCLSVCLSV